MLKTELRFITSDGLEFTCFDEARKHEVHLIWVKKVVDLEALRAKGSTCGITE